MKIRDIVNRDIVNLTNCEQEPIHIPGSIQPHGFLVGLKSDSLTIEYCSGNIESFINVSYRNLLGKTFPEIFGDNNTRALGNYAEKVGTSNLFMIELHDKTFLCHVHRSNDILIIEAEPSPGEKSLQDMYSQTKQFLSYMEANSTLQNLCQQVAENTRQITGYDRVMIYRFDEEYNGEIFAESKRDDLEPFLGLHYPHTDIPVQARELYLRNLVRLIVDIGYEPVPLYTIDDKQEKTLDLSLSTLRSVSPIHVQYLQNMGVGATLTVSLVYNGRLWGLIACHHYSAKNLLPEIKLAAQLQGHFITSQIDTRQLTEEYQLARNCNLALENLLAKSFSVDYDSFAKIASDPLLLALCNANSVAILIDDKLYTGGAAPGESTIRTIIGKIREKEIKSEFSSNEIVKALEIAEGVCDKSAGILYHPIVETTDNCIIWFRGESVNEVHWAGDPSKAIIKDEKGLSPRNSFKLWKEIVKCKSKPWLNPELNTAAQYAHALQKHVNLLMISEEEKRYRALSELLKQTNDELENINWISTHDLQEPLRKIQLFTSHLLEEESDAANNRQLVKKINNSANRMQVLLKDILKYTRVKNTNIAFEPINLNELIQSVRPEFEEAINQKKAELNIAELPSIVGIPFLMRQVFSNLILNSLKFSHVDRKPVIDIRYAGKQVYNGSENHFDVVTVSDNGIGFESKYEDNIFNVFTRLHSQKEYEGSGIGLALCKKIMQTHQGYITATGKPGEGALFSLYFPERKG